MSGWSCGITSYTCDKFTVNADIFGSMGNTVREDRIWEYEDFSIDNVGTPHIGFSGMCYFCGMREINGISYKILNCFHGKDCTDDDPAFLREKDGKVYLNLAANGRTSLSENDPTGEYLLYNFNANPGETFVSLDYSSYYDTTPHPLEVTVTDTCKMSIGNKLMKCQIVKVANSDIQITVVEGIGIVNGGWVHRPMWTKAIESTEEYWSQLNSVINRFKMDIQLEDEIIFKNKESRWKPQFIRQDRIWEYVMAVKGEPSSSIYCRMKFDGKKEVNGKTYDKFTTLDIKKIERQLKDTDTICSMSYLPYEYVERLMREENNTVYYLSQAETDLPTGGNRFNAATWDYDKPITEHYFYDFSPEINYCFVGTTCLDRTTNFWIKDVLEVIVDGKSCRLLYAPKFEHENSSEYMYPSLYFLESVGAIGKGASMTYIPMNDSTNEWFSLSRVFNGEGKQIFPIEGKKYPLGWNPGFIPDEEGAFIISSSGIKECKASTTRYISYANGIITASESHITIYDSAGKIIKEGTSSLQTDDLLPGFYIAKASGNYKTLKIYIK